MRIARVPLLLAAVLASGDFTASMAHAQAADQTVQTAGRGQFKVDDIIDRMSEAERAVLVRLRTFHPLIEVYIQNLAPDETRGWVPTDDNYFLGQFHFDNTPTLRPIGRKEPRRLLSRVMAPNLGDAFASMVAPDWRVLERKRYEFKYVRREFLGESRCFVFDVRPLRRRQGRLSRSDLDRGSRLQPGPLQRHQPRNGPDVVEPVQADGVVPRGRLACERHARRVAAVVRLLGRDRSERRSSSSCGRPGSRARRGSGDTRRRAPSGRDR